MKLTAAEEHGLRCLLQIARKGPGGSATIPEIAAREGMSEAHAAKTLHVLRNAGLVASTRGQSGGYSLARPSAQLMVADVLLLLDSPLYGDGFCDRHAGNDERCRHDSDCSIRAVWRKVQKAVDTALAGLTVQDLLRPEREVFLRTERRAE